MEELKAAVELFSHGGGRQMFKDHFVPALSVIVFTIGLTSLFAYLHYSEHIEVLEQRLRSYEERLHDVPRDNKYNRLSNKDLQREAYKLVDQLRKFEREELEKIRATTDALQRGGRLETFLETSQNLTLKFNKEFAADVTVIRKEIQTRILPWQLQSFIETHAEAYTDDALATGFLAGANPVAPIIISLEQLAKLLSVDSTARNLWSLLRWQDYVLSFCILAFVVLRTLRQLAKYHWEKFQRSLLLFLYIARPLTAKKDKTGKLKK
jgi:hypothetical protein